MAKRQSDSWVADARESMERRGTVGSYGSGKSIKTMERDVKRGGARGKKANFALNMKRAAMKRKRAGRRS
jgi:hypothetical protein